MYNAENIALSVWRVLLQEQPISPVLRRPRRHVDNSEEELLKDDEEHHNLEHDNEEMSPATDTGTSLS